MGNYAIRFPMPERNDTFTVDFCVIIGSSFINEDGDTISPYTWIDRNAENDVCCTRVTVVPKSFVSSISDYAKSASPQLYPNPANDMLHIYFENGFGPKGITVGVYGINGRQVVAKRREIYSLDKYTLSLSIRDLPEGIYQVRMEAMEGTVTRKLVISR